MAERRGVPRQPPFKQVALSSTHEVKDFTVQTAWEALVQQIELQLRAWIDGAVLVVEEDQHEVNSSWPDGDDTDITDQVELELENPQSQDTYARTIPSTLSAVRLSGLTRRSLDSSLLGLDAPNEMLRALGVHQYVVLRTMNSSVFSFSTQSQGQNQTGMKTLLMSALCAAASGCSCTVPMMLQMGMGRSASTAAFAPVIGRQLGSPTASQARNLGALYTPASLTYFKSVYRRGAAPEHLSQLAGLIEFFLAQLNCAPYRFGQVEMAVKSTFVEGRLDSQSACERRLDPADVEISSLRTPSVATKCRARKLARARADQSVSSFCDTQSHPRVKLFLSALWPRCHPSSLGRDPLAWALPPIRAPRWVLSMAFEGEDETMLALFQKCQRMHAWMKQVATAAAAAHPAWDDASSLAKQDSLARSMSEQHRSREASREPSQANTESGSKGGIGGRGLLGKLFALSDSRSQRVSESQALEANALARTEENAFVQNAGQKILAGLRKEDKPVTSFDGQSPRGHTAGEQYVVRELVELVHALLDHHKLDDTRAVVKLARLWRFLCDMIGHALEHPPFSLPSLDANSSPDLQASLITQKLQMVSLCSIRAATASSIAADTEKDGSAGGVSSWDAADDWLEWREAEHALPTTPPLASSATHAPETTEQQNDRLGRKAILEGYFRDHQGAHAVPLYEPYTRSVRHPLVTRDMLSEPLHQHSTPGATQPHHSESSGGGDCSLARNSRDGSSSSNHRVATDALLSDMSAFKAANPGCSMYDFMRWFSPSDVLGDGVLSDRMSAAGNEWSRLWQTAQAVPASEQPALFDAALAAQEALRFLEHMSVFDIVHELFYAQTRLVCAQLGAGVSFVQQFGRAAGTTNRKDERDHGHFKEGDMARAAKRLDFLVEQHFVPQRFSEILALVCDLERRLLRAFCVAEIFLSADQVVMQLDALTSEQEVDVNEPVSRYQLALSAGLDAGFSETGLRDPDMREFTFELNGRGRLYVKVVDDGFKMALRESRAASAIS
ncbi:Rab3 GTPase-activating protein catalytic subunit [Porphyridium purpureum]|uniref:Rab3 GTPase-activating protein catalytic subunit n=1 Tax=Porphyridium purpureum TaxID=35688 RepID=A0A5J4YP20_PORPP|nr:Rab3 GTPase-activating protein catalytic subunit [Porphyridium purpureum]|eukprot:POR7261..scf249_10